MGLDFRDGPGSCWPKGTRPRFRPTVARQRKFDPDLWVIEIEDRQGRTLLDEDGLR
jgi:hypothetical protein